VADFGLSKQLSKTYYKINVAEVKLPVKWTAPEAMKFGKYTPKSDSWSMGIVLYEIITRGAIPYPGMTNTEVIEKAEAGYRLSKPTECPDKLYELMVHCWSSSTEERCDFPAILTGLKELGVLYANSEKKLPAINISFDPKENQESAYQSKISYK